MRFGVKYGGKLVEDILKVHDKTIRKVTIEYAYEVMVEEKPIIPKILYCFKEKPLHEFHLRVPVLTSALIKYFESQLFLWKPALLQDMRSLSITQASD